MIDEQLQQIRAEAAQESAVQSHIEAKAKQDTFIKSNLDYENRLRGHMYKFDEDTKDGKRAGMQQPAQGNAQDMMGSGQPA